MKKRKKAPGSGRAKETYLLQGLIFCGHCGAAMQGNARKPSKKPKYVSYRCGCRLQKRMCDNKEIKKEYIEEYVLAELEKNVLNDEAIPIIMKKINAYVKEKESNSAKTIKSAIDELKQIKTQLSNVINAIASGFGQEHFKAKLEELSERKAWLEEYIEQHKTQTRYFTITEEQAKNLFAAFKEFVTERNIPECKKFLQDYVEKVTIYKEHVEVIFNVFFNSSNKSDGVKILSTVEKKTLFRRYKYIA